MADTRAQNITKYYTLPNNYIYISHLGDNGEGKYFILPNYPDSIQDSLGSTFGSETALSRSAPMYTYSNSGPRSIQISMDLHRDLMDDVNLNSSNIELEVGQDYLEALIKNLQAIAVPKYNLNNKAVEPPLVAVRICNEVFVRGIVDGGVTVTYSKPLLNNGKYAHVQVNFTVSEIDPYDATTIAKNGSFRGVTRALKKGFNLEKKE